MAPRTGADRFDQQGQGFGADAVQLGQLEGIATGGRGQAGDSGGRQGPQGRPPQLRGQIRLGRRRASAGTELGELGQQRFGHGPVEGKRMVALTTWCGALLLANTVSIASVAG